MGVKRKKAKAAPAEESLHVAEDLVAPPPIRTGNTTEWYAEARKYLVKGARAVGTRRWRECAWQQWSAFAGGSGRSTTLKAGSVEDEDLLLDWI